jgi:pantoate--beta-alanine ligase
LWTEETIEGVRRRRRQAVGRVALVPTMGALHEGHLSLMKQAAERADRVVVSLFVNPTQFGPNEDFERYPRRLGDDLQKCKDVGVEGVFAPPVAEMYPPGQVPTLVSVPSLENVFEGEIRPGHFSGVCRVVLKLLNVVQPDVSLFGQKDYQQLVVLTQMVADLNLPVEVVGCPTVREPDGLAMSSRNEYLSPEQRTQAVGLYRALSEARRRVQEENQADPEQIKQDMRSVIESHGLRVDYATVRHPATLERIDRVQAEPGAVALVAARLGKVRLIDNMRLI